MSQQKTKWAGHIEIVQIDDLKHQRNDQARKLWHTQNTILVSISICHCPGLGAANLSWCQQVNTIQNRVQKVENVYQSETAAETWK